MFLLRFKQNQIVLINYRISFMKYKKLFTFSVFLILSLVGSDIFAHGVDGATKSFLQENNGTAFIPFLYIGAKHMITGYDHLLFLVGVIFFLYRPKEVLIYVSFFTLGHSTTLLLGVWMNLNINPNLIDAIIALSIIYKGFDNLGGFKQIFGYQPNTKAAVLIFGLFHGFGLATKLQEFSFGRDGLFTNIIGFNLGVEIGQFIALVFVLSILSFWRHHRSYFRFSTFTNMLLMAAGFVLMGYQLTGYFNN